jgi:hypothetical protein
MKARFNNFAVRQHHGEKQVLDWPANVICKADKPVRKWFFGFS